MVSAVPALAAWQFQKACRGVEADGLAHAFLDRHVVDEMSRFLDRFERVVGGRIGRVEGPIIGTIVFFLLRQTLADLGSLYLLMLGAVALALMLLAPKGIWGLFAGRFGWQLLPLERRLRFAADARRT
jgi:hypothetical protein